MSPSIAKAWSGESDVRDEFGTASSFASGLHPVNPKWAGPAVLFTWCADDALAYSPESVSAE